jgi:hypothetical protein
VARPSYPLGSRRRKGRAKVTGDADEAVQAVEAGTPVVLVGEDAGSLGEAILSAPDQGRRERLLAVVVGDPADPAVILAAEEMAGELWQWAEKGCETGDWPGPDDPESDDLGANQ